ncbi:type III secretion system export apparatus subunit SctS [Roseateles sp.]|uniref:type III secretion system export apparatus subunit SctS n=1 Tax=Roseateles sp. TaxID=1971397 RepID=UPI0031CF74CA
MNAEVIQLTQQALWFVLLLSAPPIILAAIVGLLVAFVQAATQLQEQTLPYLLKFVAIVITLFVTASLLGGGLYQFADRVFSDFASLVTRH